MGIGYGYGIIRANVPQALSHFIFDAAVVGLYLAQLGRPLRPEVRQRMRGLVTWVTVLMVWPVFLLFIPFQHPLVQLVGLRGHMFFLPFLLLGARLTREDA